MNRLLKTKAMKRLTKNVKSKRGATLVELIATVAILTIVASLSLEAMYIAAEEFRRVESISECERSISLLQDNLNLYAKNATYIKLVDNSASGNLNVFDDMYDYRKEVTLNAPIDYDDLEDAENNSNHNYIYVVLYREPDNPFTYTLAKYTKKTSEMPKWEPIVSISNIKEINFSIKKLQSSHNSNSWLFDYAVIAPTEFEMLYTKANTLKEDSLDTDKYSNTEGAYSVMSGTVINNEVKGTSTSQLRMCENLPATATRGAYDGSRNFIVIKTVPREAK
ncbi:MAG: type II secretion system protein [Acutalibacteraceae bacterium]|nr:type II secretion system protein [Acutalibacteraceae bacterium]